MAFDQSAIGILSILACFTVAGQAQTVAHDYPEPILWVTNFTIRETVQTAQMVQLLDHFDPTNEVTWNQKYFYNSEFYKEGGPVFIKLGGESPANPVWMQSGFMMDLCEEFQGMAFLPEHRYWGESFPTNDLTIGSLKYLTLNQVLADFANFIKRIKIEYNLQKNKVVVIGCSYPGTLAVLLTEKYPFLMDITWASSPLLEIKYEYPEYMEVVGNVIRDISTLCYDEIKGAFDELETMIWDCHYNVTWKMDNPSDKNRPPYPQIPYCVKNVKKFMNETFRLCETFDVYKEDNIRNFFQNVTLPFQYTVQYNDQMGSNSMENYCSSVFANSTLNLTRIQKVAYFVNKMNAYFFGSSCFDYSEKRYCDFYSYTGADTMASRQWLWLQCYEIFLNPTTVGRDQPFGTSFTAQFLQRQCQCMFGERFDQNFINDKVEQQKVNFRGKDGTKYTNRMIISTGSADPWSLSGVTYQNETSCSNLVVVTEGASHCLDLLSAPSSDYLEISKTHDIIRNQMKKWLTEDIPCCS